jgi:hypothetical protein
LFLAAVQLANSQVTRNTVWSDAVRDVRAGLINTQWFCIVFAELRKRGFENEVLEHGASFLADRKRRAVKFSQFCYMAHTNVPLGTSADQLRRIRPFGVLPFLLSQSGYNSRFIFSFLCSAWRYIDGAVCKDYPAVCLECDLENSSFHVLFQCSKLCTLRRQIFSQVGVSVFDFSCLSSQSQPVHRAIVTFGRRLYEDIRDSVLRGHVESIA